MLVTFVFSCKQARESPAVAFEQGDVAFTCPAGWSIVEEDDLDGDGYYLAIEKDGFASSGLMTVSWLYDEIAPEDLVAIYQEDMASNTIYKSSDLVFKSVITDESQYYSVISSRYTFSLVGLDHQGIISAFNYGGNTFGIIKQGAIEDKDENKKGFELIESSFEIKKVD